jgi:predicted dehydrogenase
MDDSANAAALRWWGAMIRVGLIGYGRWGPNLARCIAATPALALAGVCDVSPERLAEAATAHPGARLASEWRRVVADTRIDAVAVATPAACHAEIALSALRQGKHVLVEKPLGRNSAEAIALIEESQRRHRVLMVDHTYVFSPPVRTIRELLANGAIGVPSYLDSVRIGPGTIRSDVNVIWDLAVHDLAILHHILPEAPVAVQASGLAVDGSRLEQVAYLTLRFDMPLIAHIHVNWRAPVKTRRMLIGGPRGMLAYDDLDPTAKIRVYREIGSANGAGEPWSPPLESAEPLAAVVAHFADCILNDRAQLSDGMAGLRIVRLLEAAGRSIACGGRPIELRGDGALVA